MSNVPMREQIRQAAAILGRGADAKSVYLFGSHAKGRADTDSDVDFLLVANSVLPRHKRARHLRALFNPYPFPMDIMVYTPSEFEAESRRPASFLHTVIQEAELLYGHA